MNLISSLSQAIVLSASVFHHEGSDRHNLFIVALESVSGESVGVESRNEAGVVVTISEALVLQDGFTETKVVGDTLDHVLVESSV